MNARVDDWRPKLNVSKFYIDGQWIAATSSETTDVIDPSTEDVIGNVSVGGLAECELALAAARRAFDEGPWPRMDRNERAARIQRLFDCLLARESQFNELQQLEGGLTQMEAMLHFGLAKANITEFIEYAKKDWTEMRPFSLNPKPDGIGTAVGISAVVREPFGVVLAITPYNAPILLTLIKAIPAMAAGNTVILKPSPLTPLSSFAFAEAVEAADIPPGVFNIVTGDIPVGEKLGTDPRVDMVTFTGSDVVGAKVMAQAAPTIKKVHLELGGKSALIIRHDADLRMAVQLGIMGFATQAGQGCVLTTRHIVNNKIRGDYVAAVADGLKDFKVGAALDPQTQMGPLIRENARARSESFIKRALEEGATLVSGGQRPAHLNKGFFLQPTLFDNVDNRSHLAQNEVFGPVGCVVGFDTDEEAVRLANDSRYGLGGTILSADVGTAVKMALQVRTGTISVNTGGGAGGMLPFGGYKQSGLGREWGDMGYLEYLEVKALSFPAA